MTDELPTRPFTALPPPPAGATAAVRGGHGIRRRRRLTGSGAVVASMAVVAGVLVAAGNGSPHAADELLPADRPPASVDTVPDAEPGTPDSLTVPTARPSVAAPARPSPTSTTAAGPVRPTPNATRASTTKAGGYRTPALVRRYIPAPPQTGGPAGRVCSGSGRGDTGGTIDNGSGLCVTAFARPTNRGHDLILEVCRDSTGPGSLRFARESEAELVVHDVLDKDRVVWRWSTGQPNAEDPHGLSLETNACFTWTAPWTNVDGRGRALEASDYEVAVASTADQLRGLPDQRAAFTIG